MLYINLRKIRKLYQTERVCSFISALLRPFKGYNIYNDEQKLVINCIPKIEQNLPLIKIKQDDSIELIISRNAPFSFICFQKGILIKTLDGKEQYIPYNIKEFNGKTLKSKYKLKLIKILTTYFDLEQIAKKFREVDYIVSLMFSVLIFTIGSSLVCGYILRLLL